jgi:ABC-type branched-subunit amino acid transport system substrate-binding protein
MLHQRAISSAFANPLRRDLLQLGLLAGLYPAGAWAQNHETTIKLVSHGDETGPNKPQYLPWIAGAKAVFDRANAERLLSNARIELIQRDTAGKKEAAIELTQKSLAEDKVAAFFGFGGGPVLEAVLPLINEAHIPMIGSFTGADTTRGVSPYIFHTRPAFNAEVEYVVQHISTLGHKKVIVVAIDRPIGSSGLAQISKVESKLGGEWMKLTFKQDLSDIDTAVTAVLNSQASACLVLAPSVPGVELIKRCKDKAYTGSFYGLSVLSSTHAYKVLGERARGIVVSQSSPLPSAKIPMIRDHFMPLMQKAGIAEPQVEHVEGYIAARTMVEILKRCNGRFDPATVYQNTQSLPRLDLGGMTIDFTGGNRNGSNRVFMSLISRDGKLVS